MPSSPLSALKTDDWHQMVDVNIKGVLNGVAAVLSSLAETSAQYAHWIYTISGYSGWLLSSVAEAPFRYTSKNVLM